MALRISVALCTFNGRDYLPDQLRSIAEQDRPPDELVVCDDASTDGTADIVNRFAAAAPFPVTVRVNSQTLGATKNFEQAISLCTGQVIALCDQDDVWLPRKLALTEAAFAVDPDLGFVFCDAQVCDSACRPIGYRLWESIWFSRHLRRQVRRGEAFQVNLRKNFVTGATMAFASRFKSLVLPIDPQWIHDGWIALLISAVAPVTFIRETTMLYRQHPAQSCGAPRASLFRQYQSARQMDRDIFSRHADLYESALGRLRERTEFPASREVFHLLGEKIRHYRIRSAIRRREVSRFHSSLVELLTLRYRHFSLGWKSFAQDLFL